MPGHQQEAVAGGVQIAPAQQGQQVKGNLAAVAINTAAEAAVVRVAQAERIPRHQERQPATVGTDLLLQLPAHLLRELAVAAVEEAAAEPVEVTAAVEAAATAAASFSQV